jgi:hypothetical protein
VTSVTFSNGTTVTPSRYRGSRAVPISHAWLLQATRKDGSVYQDSGFSGSERNAKHALAAAWRFAQNLMVTFEEVKRCDDGCK